MSARLRAAFTAVALLVAAIAPIAVASSAEASTHGVGFFWNGDGTTWIGSYIPDGTSIQTYCVQGALGPPTNRHDTYDAGYGQYGGGDADANARVNYAVTVFGQTSDPVNSAATAIYVHSQLDTAFYNSRPGGGLDWFASRANGSAGAVKAEFAAIADAAAGITAGPVSGSGSLTFTVDPLNNYNGTMTVSGLPAGAVGTITLTNGIFNVNGTNSVAGVTEGSVFDITGVAPEDGNTTWKISGSGQFTSPGSYAGNVDQFVTPGNRQLTVGPGQPGASFQVTGEDPVARSEIFAPIVATQVSAKYVAAGDTFGDVLTFSTAAQADGTNNSWNQLANGDYRAIVANGTLYGPFSSQPTQAATVPAGAPVAGTATASSGTTGPTQPVTVASSIVASAPGYYVWVWTIDSADQSASSQLFIPAPYTFTDQFGQVAESSIAPPNLTSQATANVLLGFPAYDTAIVQGVVFSGASVGFKAYRQGAGSVVANNIARRPAINAAADPPVCNARNLVATTGTLNVPAADSYRSEPVTFTVPGTYYWIATIYDADGNVASSGTCGDPTEITVVTQMAVTTQAGSGIVNTPVHDTATITGTIPDGATLTFKAYQQGQDNSGAAIPANTCDATNQVFDSSNQAIPLTPGVVDHVNVDGPTTTFAAPGTINWVETVLDSNGDVITAGECGASTETSTITPVPPTKTLAHTGDDSSTWLPVGIGAAVIVVLGALSLAWVARRRRKQQVETEQV